MTTQQINKILQEKFIKSSYYSSSQVRGFGYSNKGYIITPDVEITYSDIAWKGRYTQSQKQTGLFCLTYSEGRNGNGEENKMLIKINKELNKNGVKTIFDKIGKYSIKGKDCRENGKKIIFGNFKILKNR